MNRNIFIFGNKSLIKDDLTNFFHLESDNLFLSSDKLETKNSRKEKKGRYSAKRYNHNYISSRLR